MPHPVAGNAATPVPPSSHTLLVLDQGLSARTGHHFDFSRVIARELQHRELALQVFGARDADGDVANSFNTLGVPFSAHFGASPYAQARPGVDPSRFVEALLACTKADMDRLPPAGALCVHTLSPELLWAWSGMANPPPLLGVCHTLPDYCRPESGRVWTDAVRRISARKLRLSLGSIDPILRGYLGTYTPGIEIADMPMPIGGLPRKDYARSPRMVGFFGHWREERGVNLVPQLATSLLGAGFEVLVHDTQDQFRDAPSHPKLRVLGFVDDLANEIASCDILACPMDRSRYQLRVSGVVDHAVACGVPVVLPAGALPAIRAGAMACAYTDPTPQQILGAINIVAADYPRFAASAAKAANSWNSRNGPVAFADTIVAWLRAEAILPSSQLHRDNRLLPSRTPSHGEVG